MLAASRVVDLPFEPRHFAEPLLPLDPRRLRLHEFREPVLLGLAFEPMLEAIARLDERLLYDRDVLGIHLRERLLVDVRSLELRGGLLQLPAKGRLPIAFEVERLLRLPPTLSARDLPEIHRANDSPPPNCILYARPVPRILQDGAPLVRNAGVVATEVIREAIIDGRLVPGERLKEEELARELGLSRTPIREALAVLQAEGLVDTAPNRGATVRAHDAEDLDDLYRLRALLEGYAAGRAAMRMAPEGTAELFASCERFEALADG